MKKLLALVFVATLTLCLCACSNFALLETSSVTLPPPRPGNPESPLNGHTQEEYDRVQIMAIEAAQRLTSRVDSDIKEVTDIIIFPTKEDFPEGAPHIASDGYLIKYINNDSSFGGQ